MNVTLNIAILSSVLIASACSSTTVRPNPARSSGAIAGCVRGLEDGRPISAANVQVSESNFGALTDNDGRFIIPDIPHGEYTIVTGKLWFHRTRFLHVKVMSDSVTILRIGLSHAAIPEEPVPVMWVADTASFKSLTVFAKDGGILGINCSPLY